MFAMHIVFIAQFCYNLTVADGNVTADEVDVVGDNIGLNQNVTVTCIPGFFNKLENSTIVEVTCQADGT